jgi:hypothetical protein
MTVGSRRAFVKCEISGMRATKKKVEKKDYCEIHVSMAVYFCEEVMLRAGTYHAVPRALCHRTLVMVVNRHLKGEVIGVGPEDHAIHAEAGDAQREVAVLLEEVVVEEPVLLEEDLVNDEADE